MTKNKKDITVTMLTELRRSLILLHQSLLDYQRKSYEKKNGRVASTGKMYDLVTNNKQFAWLRSLSELVVGLDGYLDKKEFTQTNVRSLIMYTKKLLKRNKVSTDFEKLYFAAIEKDPEVLLAHRDVMQVLAAK